MADRYWVGGGSSTNWSATGNTNWAATSGGAGNQSVPGTGDNVFFDGNSGSGASVISASQSIGTLTMTGASISGLTHNNSVTLTVDGAGGNFILAAGKYTGAGTTSNITFTGAGTFSVNFAGNNFTGTITTNGASTVTQLAAALTGGASTTIALTAGHFDANDFAVTAGVLMDSSNSTARTISMGSGLWTAVGVGTFWQTSTITNLTFNKETANILWSPNGASNASGSFASGALTFNDLTLSSPNAGTVHTVTIGAGGMTFANLNIGAGNIISLSASHTISTAPTWAGTPSQPIILMSAAGATTRTLTFSSGNASLNWGLLASVAASGGSPTATNTINFGNSAGWTVTPPASGFVIGG